MSFLGRKGFTLLPSPNAISPSGSVHDKLELELELELVVISPVYKCMSDSSIFRASTILFFVSPVPHGLGGPLLAPLDIASVRLGGPHRPIHNKGEIMSEEAAPGY